MKSKFSGYFKPKTEEIQSLWKDSTFVLDTNVLLNLYRYSDETREEFFRILEKIQERIWIPNQVGTEFFTNRLSVIDSQEKTYDDAIKSLEKNRK